MSSIPSEFERDKHIDPNLLDVACVEHPDVFWKYAELAVQAKSRMDRLEQKMELTEAQLSLEARKDPTAFDIEGRGTDATIKAVVRAHRKYTRAVEEWQDAKEDSAYMDRALRAMEIKKSMIEDLITLHGQQYFAGPSVPHNLGELYIKQQKASHDALNKRTILAYQKKHHHEEGEEK